MKFEITPIYGFALNHIRQNTNHMRQNARKRSYLKDSCRQYFCVQIKTNISKYTFCTSNRKLLKIIGNVKRYLDETNADFKTISSKYC